MLKQPKAGDTVIFHAVVDSIHNDFGNHTMFLSFIDCQGPGVYPNGINAKSVHEVISSPPKVGDLVNVEARDKAYPASNKYSPCTLLCIHQGEGDDRKWGVIAFKGDMPRGVYFDDLSVAD